MSDITYDIREKLLSRVKENNREKVQNLLDDCLHHGDCRMDIYDVDYCLSGDNEIEYLEFNPKEEVKADFSIHGMIKGILVAISGGDNEELSLDEVVKYLKIVERVTGQRPATNGKMFWNSIHKAPAGLMRLLVVRT